MFETIKIQMTHIIINFLDLSLRYCHLLLILFCLKLKNLWPRFVDLENTDILNSAKANNGIYWIYFSVCWSGEISRCMYLYLQNKIIVENRKERQVKTFKHFELLRIYVFSFFECIFSWRFNWLRVFTWIVLFLVMN